MKKSTENPLEHFTLFFHYKLVASSTIIQF